MSSRRCSVCREPGHIRSHCPTVRPLPQYTVSDMQGIELLEFLRGILIFCDPKSVDILSGVSREYARYSQIAGTHMSRGDHRLSSMRQEHPGLQIVRVRFREMLTRDCQEYPTDSSDNEEQEPEEYYLDIFVALPVGLVGDISSIEVSQFKVMELSYCWCGGDWASWEVLSIELV